MFIRKEHISLYDENYNQIHFVHGHSIHVRMHNGTINLTRSDSTATVFTLVFK